MLAARETAMVDSVQYHQVKFSSSTLQSWPQGPPKRIGHMFHRFRPILNKRQCNAYWIFAGHRQAYRAALYPLSDMSRDTCNSVKPTSSFPTSLLDTLIAPMLHKILAQPSQVGTSGWFVSWTQSRSHLCNFWKGWLARRRSGATNPSGSDSRDKFWEKSPPGGWFIHSVEMKITPMTNSGLWNQ